MNTLWTKWAYADVIFNGKSLNALAQLEGIRSLFHRYFIIHSTVVSGSEVEVCSPIPSLIYTHSSLERGVSFLPSSYLISLIPMSLFTLLRSSFRSPPKDNRTWIRAYPYMQKVTAIRNNSRLKVSRERGRETQRERSDQKTAEIVIYEIYRWEQRHREKFQRLKVRGISISTKLWKIARMKRYGIHSVIHSPFKCGN